MQDGSVEPPLPGDVGLLLQEMEGAEVKGAMIVQPSNHMFDHSYVTKVLKTYPQKFVGCLLANPDEVGLALELFYVERND